jgi:hypothetical protein
MNIKEVIKKCGGDSQIWDNKNSKWLTKKDDKEIQYAIIFGDDGGDTFMEEFDSEEKFSEGLNQMNPY